MNYFKKKVTSNTNNPEQVKNQPKTAEWIKKGGCGCNKKKKNK
ncbi:MAG: hypothetical protein K0S34_1642 [Bacillales bacterium]|jgi:hypothetical protein|nr:hypothetical protein [Bacillales bacterium]